MSAFARWRAQRSPREQRLVALAVLVVGGALAWLLLIDPLLRDLANVEDALADAKVALARAEAQRGELAAAKPAAAAAGDARAAVERLVVQRGLRGALTALQAKDGRVELTFEAIDFAALTGLVDALARDARLVPVEALLAPRTTPGSVRAELALRRSAP